MLMADSIRYQIRKYDGRIPSLLTMSEHINYGRWANALSILCGDDNRMYHLRNDIYIILTHHS